MGTWTSALVEGAVTLLIFAQLLAIAPVATPVVVVTLAIFGAIPRYLPRSVSDSPLMGPVVMLVLAQALFLIFRSYIVITPFLLLAVSYSLHAMYDYIVKFRRKDVGDQCAPVSVNYFPSRECNYACGFWFHTNTSGYILPIDQAKRGLRYLKGKNQSFAFAAPAAHLLGDTKRNIAEPEAFD